MGLIAQFKKINWRNVRENLAILLKEDLRDREEELIYRIKDEALEECVREFEEYNRNGKFLQVVDAAQTMELLEDFPKSYCRYGDGEIAIMEGKDTGFQAYDPRLAEKMRSTLAQKRDDVYVGLNRAYWESPNRFAERHRRFYRVWGTYYRRFFTEHCDDTAVYLDATAMGAYLRFDDSFDYESHYQRIKRLFAGKKVAIVAGEGVFEKLNFNVFEEAQAQIIVHGLRMNAFSEYDALIERIKQNVPKDYLVCLILGQTATAIVPDLTDLGYMAWDVGHVAKEYDAYMNKMEKTQENLAKFWAPD